MTGIVLGALLVVVLGGIVLALMEWWYREADRRHARQCVAQWDGVVRSLADSLEAQGASAEVVARMRQAAGSEETT